MHAILNPVRYNDLGIADFGWLKARYHFSFARYYNPNRMGFGKLRVINDDIVKAGHGFAPHDHDNMEIITYVRSGAISHRDSKGNEGKTEAGNVQVMSAGAGIIHSEFNHEKSDATLYQIWIEPREMDVAPRWDMRSFPSSVVTDSLPLLVSGMAEHVGRDALFIHQDAAIYGGRMVGGTTLSQPLKHQGYILVSEGRILIQQDGKSPLALEKGDGAEITGAHTLTITAESDCEILVIDCP